jgi:hypothetical protein
MRAGCPLAQARRIRNGVLPLQLLSLRVKRRGARRLVRNMVIRMVLFMLCATAAAMQPEGPEGPAWVPDLLSPEEAVEGFFPLFNGKDLDGWVRRDRGGVFIATNGLLVATGGEEGAWLLSTQPFANFVLRYEYRTRPGGGEYAIVLHAAAKGDPASTGVLVQTQTPGAVESAQPQSADDGWNQVEVTCNGAQVGAVLNNNTPDSARTRENPGDEDQQDPSSKCSAVGPIGIRAVGGSVHFRRIRLRPLPGGPGWRPLFNGQDLDGWETLGDARWEVLPGGILHMSGQGMTERSALRTQASFRDFELRLSARAHDDANSGVFIRGSGKKAWPKGYEVQIDNHNPEQFTGAVWDQVPARELRAMDNCWFQMVIKAQGANIQVAVNGKTVVDFISNRHSRYPEGCIALQAHDPKSTVDFRDIEIRPLNGNEEGL